jgi:esterase
VILHYRKYACLKGADSQPLLILHGLYGHQGNWAAHAREFAADFTVYALDARNHGLSAHADSMSLEEMARDVCDTMDALGLASAHVLGHSMGGKVAMLLALLEPQRVTRLLVVDIAPVAYARGDSHILEALCGIDLTSLGSRAEADALLAAAIPSKPVRDFLLANLQKAAAGSYSWRFNLPVLRRCFKQIIGWPAHGRQWNGPVLFIKGELSDYILPEHRQATLAQFPAAMLKTVVGAGHWVHSEKPESFRSLALRFLRAYTTDMT